jgi:serine phosphatase RsbU (regulator of sigma subunit)/Tfp pilus assembly protein PilF
MKRALAWFFGLLSSIAVAQYNTTDSLARVLHSSAPDTSKADAYVRLCMAYSSNNPDTCILYTDSAIAFLKQKNLPRYFAIVYRLRGVAYVNLGKYEESLKCYFDALRFAESAHNNKDIASILNNIGVNYWYQKSFAKAKEYYLKAHALRLAIGNKKEISKSLNNLGIISVELRDFAEAIRYYTQSLAIKKEIGDETGIANCYNNLGIVYEELKKPGPALENYKLALALFEKIDDTRGKLVSYNNIANIMRLKKDFAGAELHAKKGLAIAQEINDKEDIKASFEILAGSCYNQGKYKDAYDYLAQYSLVKDTLYSLSKAEAMQEMETRYQTEKKEQELQIKDLRIRDQQGEIKKARIIRVALFGGLVLLGLISLLILNRYLLKKKANLIITEQKKVVEEKNHEILDSIRYAKHIQEAILPHGQYVRKILAEHFILYKPKDIVSGDFYFVEETDTHKYFAAVDCTGHGVPGAFISIVGANGLSRCVKEFRISDPGQLLDKLNELVNETLRQKMHESRIRDGMDIALCVLDKKTNVLRYAGANNPLYYVRKGVLTEIKANGQPIGTFMEENSAAFTTHTLEVQQGDVYYVFTDGFADQFGGPKGKKYKYKQLKDFLTKIHNSPAAGQKKKLEEEFEAWRGNLEQIDDLCIIGYMA